MSRRIPIIMLTVILTVSFFPAVAQAQSEAEETTTDVTFYGHIFGITRGNPMPMNTQFPAGEADLSQGLSNQGCDPYTPSEVFGSCEATGSNEEWWYTTAGFVQIKDYTEFSYDKLHNERGLTKDTYLDTSRDIKSEFYMSADAHGWLLALCTPNSVVPVVPRDTPWPIPCWNWDPGYLPQWQVEATIYTAILGEYGGQADEAPDIASALEAGKLTILAQGVSDIVDVQSLEVAGQPIVWKFPVNLGKPQRDVILKEESYVVRHQWWSVKPNGDRVIVANVDKWNVDGGEYFPPTITLPVKGAFNVELVLPQFVHDKLVILGIMNTPWGSYDVNQDTVKLEITNKAGTPVNPVRIEKLADFSVAHGGHYKPVNITYVWDYQQDKLPPGEYSVKISGSNFQESATASCTGSFTILSGGKAGPIKVGECGRRTISDDQLNTVKEGSASDAAGSKSSVPLVRAPPLKLASANVTPVGVLAWEPLAAFAVAGLAFFARRWSK